MTREQKLKLLLATDGKIFSCIFRKKDGTLRKMVCRLNVKQGVTGQGMGYDPISKGLLPVFDMTKKAFRMVNLDTIVEANISKRLYQLG